MPLVVVRLKFTHSCSWPSNDHDHGRCRRACKCNVSNHDRVWHTCCWWVDCTCVFYVNL